MEKVSKQLVVTYKYSTKKDYEAALRFARELFAYDIDSFEEFLGHAFENAGIE